jgi:LysM repeat protein
LTGGDWHPANATTATKAPEKSTVVPSKTPEKPTVVKETKPSVPTPEKAETPPQPGDQLQPRPPKALPVRIYKVAKGDTAYSIARRHNVDWQELLRANGLSDPRQLRADQVIRIP